MRVDALKQILRHTSVTTTEFYAQFDDEKLAGEIGKVKPIGESEIPNIDLLEEVLDKDA